VAEYGKRGASEELVQTLRLLARSHRRFTEEQKTKVFRSVVRAARLKENGVELELYVQATKNVWWRYRNKANRQNSSRTSKTIHVDVPQRLPADRSIYTVKQAALQLGIGPGALRWRLKAGKYPDAPRGNAGRRQFTSELIQKIRALG